MDVYINCPKCATRISDDPVIVDAANNEGSGTRIVTCTECGERISYWDVLAIMRKQKKLGWKVQNFFRSIFQPG